MMKSFMIGAGLIFVSVILPLTVMTVLERRRIKKAKERNEDDDQEII